MWSNLGLHLLLSQPRSSGEGLMPIEPSFNSRVEGEGQGRADMGDVSEQNSGKSH